MSTPPDRIPLPPDYDWLPVGELISPRDIFFVRENHCRAAHFRSTMAAHSRVRTPFIHARHRYVVYPDHIGSGCSLSVLFSHRPNQKVWPREPLTFPITQTPKGPVVVVPDADGLPRAYKAAMQVLERGILRAPTLPRRILISFDPAFDNDRGAVVILKHGCVIWMGTQEEAVEKFKMGPIEKLLSKEIAHSAETAKTLATLKQSVGTTNARSLYTKKRKTNGRSIGPVTLPPL